LLLVAAPETGRQRIKVAQSVLQLAEQSQLVQQSEIYWILLR